MKDIAEALNISVSTVSRALADCWDINKDTRNRVLRKAKELNYRPNPFAKKLQHRSSGTIGLIIPEFINSYFPEVIIGIQDVLDKENYQLLITQSNESSKNELKNLIFLENNMVEGIIISLTREGGNGDEFKRVIDNGIPIVFFNRVSNNVEAPKVIIDDRKMAQMAVEHLIKKGYKRIAHITGPKSLFIAEERKKGYIDALEKYNLKVDDSLIFEGGVMVEKGEIAIDKLFKNHIPLPDAIFAFNDPIAIGAMKIIKRHNLNIPKDIAVVGFSESQMATIVEPSLTTVQQPTFEIGRKAALLLIEQIKSTKKIKPQTVCLEAKLNVRNSS